MSKNIDKPMDKRIYLVGGAIRDMLLKTPIKDRDYVAVGYDVCEFSHLKQVGKDFPVFIREDGSELALARREKKCGAGYGGFSVETKSISLEDDLKRRDLTINSIAFDEEESRFIDPYGGMSDINKKILRHTSDAFVEDPLRVLRLARFRAKLGSEWRIYHSTKVLVFQMRDELKNLQKDRVYKEVELVLGLENSHIFYETLFELGVLEYIFPSIYELTRLKEGSIYHKEGSVFIHTMMVLEMLKNSSPTLKLTALYHDIAKPYCYRRYGNSQSHDKIELVEPLIDLQIPSKIKKRVLFLIENHIKIALLFKMRVSKVVQFFKSFKRDRELLIDLLEFYDADNGGRFMDIEKEELDKGKILLAFDEISSYSPKAWMESRGSIPSKECIIDHIQKQNRKVIIQIFKE